MRWDVLLLGASAVLGLLLVLMPVYAAVRDPAFPWGRAALCVGAALLAVPVFTLVFCLLFSLLSGLVPGLNPFTGPAYESVDAGLFTLFVGLTAALAVVCLAQFRWLRARLRRSSSDSHSPPPFSRS